MMAMYVTPSEPGPTVAEVIACEGDLIGETRDELRSLHLSRDRDRDRDRAGGGLGAAG
jgi:hypothetical protein